MTLGLPRLFLPLLSLLPVAVSLPGYFFLDKVNASVRFFLLNGNHIGKLYMGGQEKYCIMGIEGVQHLFPSVRKRLRITGYCCVPERVDFSHKG